MKQFIQAAIITFFFFNLYSSIVEARNNGIKKNSKSSSYRYTNALEDIDNSLDSTTQPISIIADDAWCGQRESGYITIQFAASDADGVIRKPLIVAEGFDPGNITNPEQLTGTLTLSDFVTGYLPNSSNLDALLTNHYDIIYVDWQNSEDYIQRNALLLEKVIKKVNLMSGNVPIVLIGQSMGGLASRWALKDMENKGITHHVSTFINWDGPQQGVNVPIAYQYMSRQARSLYNQSAIPGIFNLYNTFTRPIYTATALINRVNVSFFGACQTVSLPRP
jgi:hypothetical protein